MAWMNGKRTVYCRHCGIKGHNRATCPERSNLEKVQAKELRAARACGWCRETGHDVRHCEKKRTDYANWYKRNAVAREKAFNAMILSGMLPGALVKNEYHASTGTYMILNFDLSKVADYDIPSPKGKSWRQITRARRRVARTSFIEADLLSEGAGGRWADKKVFIDPADEISAPKRWNSWVIIAPSFKAPSWDNVPEDIKSGIRGTERLWK